MSTYLDAAYHILQQTGQPLRYEDSRARAGAAAHLAPGADPGGYYGLTAVHGHTASRLELYSHERGDLRIVAETASQLYNAVQQHEWHKLG